MDSVGLLTRFFTTEWCNMFLLLENQALGGHMFFFVNVFENKLLQPSGSSRDV